MVLFRIVAGVLVLACLSPILSVVAAGTIADLNGCRLHEGFVNPCIVWGRDIGSTLYGMGMMGWLSLATLPLLGAVVVVWIAVEVVRWLRNRRRAAVPPAR